MKSIKTIGIIVICILLNFIKVQSQTDNNLLYYEISHTFNFKKSIFSITFDDADLTQFSVAFPLLNKLQIPATFYVINYKLPDTILSNYIIKANKNGHEIGSHSFNHENLTDYTSSGLEKELSQSKEGIDLLLKSKSCLTLAYPFGAFNDTVIQYSKKYFIGARSTILGYNSIDNFEQYKLKVKFYTSNTSLGALKSIFNYSVAHNLWIIELFHGVNGIGYQPVNADTLLLHLNHVKAYEDKTWFATISDVVKYSEEAKNSILFCISCNDSILKLRLNDNLDDSVYNHALSISIKVPGNWSNNIFVDGAELTSQFTKYDTRFVQLNALPNNELITIKPESINMGQAIPEISILNIKPNPFQDWIDVKFEVSNPVGIQIRLVNLAGRIIRLENINTVYGVNNIRFPTDMVKAGTYLLEIEENNAKGNIVKVEKLIKFN